MKKTLSLLLVTAMVISIFAGMQISSSALQPSGKCGDNVYWTFDDATGLLTISGSGKMRSFDYYFYSEEFNSRMLWGDYNGDYCYEYSTFSVSPFNKCEGIKDIVITNGVTNISQGAFQDCCNLETVTISSSVNSIDYYAFDGCVSLRNISFGYGLSLVSNNAFNNCTSLDNLLFPNSITGIGTFNNCTSLKNIKIPYGVQYVSGFLNCTSLESLNIPNSVTSLGSFSGCTALKNVNIPSGVQRISKQAFQNCKNLESIVIPYGVETLYARTFDGCESLKNISIPQTVTYIGGSCFNNCFSLEDIELPDNLTEIKNGVFYNCKSLKEIILPTGIEKIGDSAFLGCESLKNIAIPDATETIKNCVFSNCKSLENVYIGANCSSIGYDVFTGCTLNKIEVSNNNVTYNDNGNALNETATHNLIKATQKTVIPIDTLTIENGAFANLSIESLDIPASVISIGQSAFSNCTHLNEVNINNGLNNIGYGCFEGCSNLIYVELPESVNSIESHAFWNCPRLKNVTVNNGDCYIADDYKTFSARAVISGTDNSSAFNYAMNYNRNFILLNHNEHTWVTEKIVPATITKSGKIIYCCAVCDEMDIEVISMPKTFTLTKTSYLYTGKAIIPAVVVRDSQGEILANGIDYTVSYKNNVNVGTASVVISFKGNYTGTKTLNFSIIPSGTSLSKVTSAKKAFNAQWKANKTVTGYQMQYTASNKSVIKTVKGATKLKLSVTGLKGGAKYIVKVRTFKTIGGKNYYSTWSGAKSVKTKK